MNTIKCNMCDKEFEDYDDLDLITYDGEEDDGIKEVFGGCGKCKTDQYLMDINQK